MNSDRWQRISQLYHAALSYSAPDRAAFLREACAGDPALQQEVESLLSSESNTPGFRSEPAAGIAAQMVSHPGGSTLIGRQIGVYRLEALLGAGGMAEVYRARDTKLGRDVAVKILPPAFTADRDRVTRFQREARVLATLNHPNIATIHGIEESDGVHGIVMELVEGETLAERIRRGRLPVPGALGIARQIVDALDAAHEKGIVHRDLKPANIKITAAGIVKVLDFGLAKLDPRGAFDAGALSQSPTVTIGGTREGVIAGTVAYMSPEQARGTQVDKRTDIWAFGCVLYQMLTGRVTFDGKTASDTIAAILEHEPDWNALPATMPMGIDRLLRHCLEKDPTHRLRDVGDVRIEIDDALVVQAGKPTTKGRQASRPITQWAVLVVMIIAAAIGSWRWINYSQRPASEPARSTARFSIQFPPDAPIIGSVGIGSQIALSPDGSQLAYAARAGQGVNHLYLRKVDQLESRLIPGTEGAVDPFFSPDGQWLGFFAGQRLMKVALAGGLPQTICELGPSAGALGASWSSDDTVVFAKAGAGIWRVSSAGGTPTPVTSLRDREANHLWPDVLPGGDAILFSVASDTGDPHIYAQSLKTGERHILGAGVGAHYLPSGHLVYGLGSSLFAISFDLGRLGVAGEAVRIVDNVFNKGGGSGALPQAAFSKAGTLAFVPTTPSPQTLVWVDRRGEERSLNVPTRSYFQPRLAPDEHRLAVMITGEDYAADVWLWDFSRENLSRLTDDGSHNYLLWTPDGERVSFLSGSGPIASGGRGNITWKRVEGSNAESESLLSGQASGPPLSWSPDGRVLAFVNIDPVNRQDIWTMRLDEKSQPRPFLRTRFAEGAPAFSPDGRWLAYVSDESGRSEVYVQSFPTPGEKFLISTGGGSEIVWPRRGHELFYRTGDAMMAVEVRTGSTFTSGKPRRLFDGRYAQSTSLWPNYDVTADGQRFVLVKGVEEFTSTTQVNVVLNWDQELKRRVPSK